MQWIAAGKTTERFEFPVCPCPNETSTTERFEFPVCLCPNETSRGPQAGFLFWSPVVTELCMRACVRACARACACVRTQLLACIRLCAHLRVVSGVVRTQLLACTRLCAHHRVVVLGCCMCLRVRVCVCACVQWKKYKYIYIYIYSALGQQMGAERSSLPTCHPVQWKCCDVCRRSSQKAGRVSRSLHKSSCPLHTVGAPMSERDSQQSSEGVLAHDHEGAEMGRSCKGSCFSKSRCSDVKLCSKTWWHKKLVS